VIARRGHRASLQVIDVSAVCVRYSRGLLAEHARPAAMASHLGERSGVDIRRCAVA